MSLIPYCSAHFENYSFNVALLPSLRGFVNFSGPVKHFNIACFLVDGMVSAMQLADIG